MHAGGKTLYAGTENGAIRAYKLPLSGEYAQICAFHGAVTRLRLGADDASLFATSADGALFVFDIRDRDPTRAITRRCRALRLLHAVWHASPSADTHAWLLSNTLHAKLYILYYALGNHMEASVIRLVGCAYCVTINQQMLRADKTGAVLQGGGGAAALGGGGAGRQERSRRPPAPHS